MGWQVCDEGLHSWYDSHSIEEEHTSCGELIGEDESVGFTVFTDEGYKETSTVVG